VDDAAFLISVIGISNTIGRVLFGWLSDFPWVSNTQRHILTDMLPGTTVPAQLAGRWGQMK